MRSEPRADGSLGAKRSSPRGVLRPCTQLISSLPFLITTRLHCHVPHTEREAGRGPRTIAARESEALHGLSLCPPARGCSGRPLGLGYPQLPRCRFCVEKDPHRNHALHAPSLMMSFAKPLHQRQPRGPWKPSGEPWQEESECSEPLVGLHENQIPGDPPLCC